MLKKIISGGQTGADIGALKAAKALGLQTGGWLPKGCLTLEGPNPQLLELYDMCEHSSSYYPRRTYANVHDSQGTIRFALKFTSPGERCTHKAIKYHNRPYLDVDITKPRPVRDVTAWITEHGIECLNVAGNSESTAPGIEVFVTDYMTRVIRESVTLFDMNTMDESRNDEVT